MTVKKPFLFITLLLAAALMLAGCMNVSAYTAEDTLAETFAVTGETRVFAETFNGSITVEAGSADEVTATVFRTAGGGSQSQAEQLLEQIDVTFEQNGSEIRVTARFDQITVAMVGAEIRLTVPTGTLVEAATSNGDIVVSGVGAAVDLDTSNGTISLTGGVGDTRVNTSNGQIELEAVDADVTAETSNGAIRFSGSLAPGSNDFNTSNGEVELLLAADSEFALDAHTSNGNVDCGFALTGITDSDDNNLVAQIGSDPAVRITIRSSNGTIRVNPLP